MRVIDASALAKYLNREAGWKQVEELLLEGCVTVELALKEAISALWKRFKRKEMTESQVLEIANAFLSLKIVRIHPQDGLLTDALGLSLKLDTTVYDALYIVLAKKLRMDLITSDKVQAKKAEQTGINTLCV